MSDAGVEVLRWRPGGRDFVVVGGRGCSTVGLCVGTVCLASCRLAVAGGDGSQEAALK